MSVRSRVELLRQIPLFAEAADAHLQLLAFAMESASFAAGDVIVGAGERDSIAYVVEKGSARLVSSQAEDGTETKIGPGACIGELSMVADLPYNITVVAETNVQCLKLTRQLFYRVAEEFPDFAEIILAAVTRRVEHSVGQLKSVEKLFRQARPFSAL